VRVAVSVKGDGSGNFVHLILRDSQNEEFTYDLGRMLYVGWRELSCDVLSPPNNIEGPMTGNAFPDPPMTLVGLRVVYWKDGNVPQGTTGFDDLTVESQVLSPQ
jgi:hypothetical protein